MVALLDRLNNWGSTTEEVAASVPGDDLFQGGRSGTRSIDIDAEPEVVFDFLSQMGFGRAGWYSYDWIDNLGRRSADDLHPEWMVATPGDLVPGGPIDFVVEEVDRPGRLVLRLGRRRFLGHQVDFSLAYRLADTSAGEEVGQRTRVVSRARMLVTGPLGAALTSVLLVGDAVMVRRQLLGLKERAERHQV